MISSQATSRITVFSFMLSLVLCTSFNAQTLAVVQYPENHKDVCYQTQACYSVPVGSSDVNSDRLKPYSAKWTQLVRDEGQFVSTPVVFEETLSLDEDGNWLHTQTVTTGGVLNGSGIRTLDRQTLEVLSLELLFQNPAEGQPSKVYYDLTETEFAADVTFADGRKQKGQSRFKAIPMFDGQIAGVTIAALPLKQGYSATLPMIIPNLGVYWIEVTVVSRRKIAAGQRSDIDVWEVEAHWLNLTDGDIYPSGRDGSGGVYYIAAIPEPGMPHVIEYANDTSVISWDGIIR
ncbi:hypothetical protein [Kordiimonas aquimaris]|uniref:hypothetical protein n=1 Tax=Kordiimonas aquimaris TaxID=707591 RepID=UPI0021CFA043|nr:hypothetical protein [Kordiimonas aquimaris]